MPAIKTYIIDAFTRQAFSGNPAGVCLLEDNVLSDATMQAIAAELNVSETAFLAPDISNPSSYNIRYFTPAVEIDFCGHATLASAKLVLSTTSTAQVTFTTAKGLVLQASQAEEEAISMKFPLYATKQIESNSYLAEALGLPASLPLHFCPELQMLVVEVPDKATLQLITPDYVALLQAVTAVKGLAVTTTSEDGGIDFYSRCFWPWVGINEDPVTGSAHSALASYWGERLQKKEMKAWQLSARGGYLDLKILSSTELEVKSHAQLVLEGNLHVPA